MSRNHVYSLKEVVATIVGPGGAFSLGAGAGVADEAITIQYTGDRNTMQVGPDGYGQHSLNNDRSGTFTVVLQKTSPTNAQLMLMFNFQTGDAANHGQNTISLVDKNRGDAWTCQQCAFTKAPDQNYQKDAGTNTWVFQCIRMDGALGANF